MIKFIIALIIFNILKSVIGLDKKPLKKQGIVTAGILGAIILFVGTAGIYYMVATFAYMAQTFIEFFIIGLIFNIIGKLINQDFLKSDMISNIVDSLELTLIDYILLILF